MKSNRDEKDVHKPKDPEEARGANILGFVPRADRDGEPTGKQSAAINSASQQRSSLPLWDDDDDDPGPTAS